LQGIDLGRKTVSYRIRIGRQVFHFPAVLLQDPVFPQVCTIESRRKDQQRKCKNRLGMRFLRTGREECAKEEDYDSSFIKKKTYIVERLSRNIFISGFGDEEVDRKRQKKRDKVGPKRR